MTRATSNGVDVSRRTLLKAAVAGGAVAATGALSGCSGSAAASDRQAIQLWHLFTGGDGGVFQDMMALVQKQNTKVAINPVVLTWGGPYYTKLAMASVGGRAPDLAVMHLTRVVGYAPGGLLEPWDLNHLAQYGVTPDMFTKSLWDRAYVDGLLYAIPLDFHAFPLLYNKDICKKAGVLNGSGNLTGVDSPDGFVEVAKKVSEVTNGPSVSYGYTADGGQMSRMLWTLYAQQGAKVELTPGQDAVFDTGAATKAIAWVQQWLNDKLALRNTDYSASIASFSTKRTGLNFNGNWEVPTFLKAGINLGAMPFPTLFGTPGTYGDSHSFVLPKQVNVDEKRRDAAYQVVAGMLKNSVNWAKGGHIPAYKQVLTSPEYLAMKPQSDYVSAMEHAVFEPRAWFTGSGSSFQSDVGQVIQEAWLNEGSASKAADGLRAAFNLKLHTQPPA